MRNHPGQKQITIILPVYNNVNTIEKTVKSVISQEEFNSVDFLVIDNNSNDGTSELLKLYQDRLRLIRYNQTVDMASNWQRGIDESNSEYLTMIHADDWYKQGTIKHMINTINSDSLNTELFVYRRRVHNGRNSYLIDYECHLTKYDLVRTFPGIATVMKRSFLRYKYEPRWFPIFDYVWFVRNLFMIENIGYINGAELNVYTGPLQTTNNVNWLSSIIKSNFFSLGWFCADWKFKMPLHRHLWKKLLVEIKKTMRIELIKTPY